MNVVKNRMNVTVVKGAKNVQTIIDTDMNVPDSKPDIEKIIATRQEVMIQNVEVMVDKLKVEGKVQVSMLYATYGEKPTLASFIQSVSFDEMIHMDGVLPMDMVKVTGMVEDSTISIINSRKLGIKGILSLFVSASDVDLMEGCVEIQDEKVQQLQKKIHLSSMVVNKKDSARIKEKIILPNNKPNIGKVIWYDIQMSHPEIKIQDGMVPIRGDLQMFLLYEAADQQIPIQCLEYEMAFHTNVECSEARESMIENIGVTIGSKQMDVKADEDGEERLLELELSLDLDMKIYDDIYTDLLWDAYIPAGNLKLDKKKFHYEKLLMKNSGKTKINKRIRLGENQPDVMQLCHVDGSVKVDESRVVENGILVEGILEVNAIYISNQDHTPLNSIVTVIPFSYTVETAPLNNTDHYDMQVSLDQLTGTVLDGEEIEYKGTINVTVLTFEKEEMDLIVGTEEETFDIEEFQRMPGMVGYYVKEGDTLWKIAKRYHTTVDTIRQMNELTNDDLAIGDRLIIVKDCNMV